MLSVSPWERWRLVVAIKNLHFVMHNLGASGMATNLQNAVHHNRDYDCISLAVVACAALNICK
jgi:hypothetical protein